LRARVALEAPADEEPGDAEDEDLRAGACRGDDEVRTHVARVALAEGAGDDVVQDLAGPDERGRDAERDGDEAFERAQRRVAVVGEVLDRDGTSVNRPQERAADNDSARSGEGSTARPQRRIRPRDLQQ